MKGTRLPENWLPEKSLYFWAQHRRADLNIVEQIEMFRDYWCAKTGKDATKLDWNRTFRNWIRSARALPLVNASPKKEHHTPSPRQEEPRRLPQEKRSENLQRLGDLLANLGAK